jgi:hypothetical protein
MEKAAVPASDQADLCTGTQEAERYRGIEAGAGGEIFGLQASIAKVLGKTQRSSGGDKLRANKADDLDPQ